VETGALVTNINVSAGRATGVTYLRDGQLTSALAGEIILAGGAVNSPHLLQVSGIGPVSTLEAAGIGVVHDLPGVGANLMDHLAAGVIRFTSRTDSLAAAETPRQVFDYFTRRRGLLTSNVGEAHAFIKTDAGLDEPDIELIFAPVPYLDHGDTEPPGHGYTVAAVLLQPESRGTIEPKSSNPAEAPAIDPKYLAEEPDLRTLRAGVEKAAEIFETSPLSGFTGDWIRPERPMSSQEDVDRAIRGFSETLYHPAGTCRMGTDDLAVVDPDLRVHGIAGLRVADPSVMPMLNRGHTHAPAVMIGEKAAELVTA
jgi:choline dehydrogenase